MTSSLRLSRMTGRSFSGRCRRLLITDVSSFSKMYGISSSLSTGTISVRLPVSERLSEILPVR